ncbi:hypothetical protein [Dyella terrae]|uniref:hypothetical protein n=1 Tax=Dyella terrae TaxID=522259 RepID=UPI001EFCBBE0|nr:hypothetical protein [Dyella terrae]ULU26611.1 hypothetical protein DYST_03557 [Dyella terrae]
MKLAMLLGLALLGAAVSAHADELKGDAIVCETPEPLAMLAKPNLAGQPGSVVMKRVDATAKFYKLSGQANGTLAEMTAQEDRIRAAGQLSGNSSAQATQAVANQQSATTQQNEADSFLRRCATTGSDVQQVSVIERHPISGEVKIRAMIKGASADVWTIATYLR